MFLTAREGNRIVNQNHIVDVEILQGCYPLDPEGSKHPYRIVAHTTDGTTVELAREENPDVAHELMRTYIRVLNGKNEE